MPDSKPNWDDWRLALALARTGKAATAAEALGVDASTVLRRVKNLEQQLGVRLFELSGHVYLQSEVGQRVLQAAERMEHEVRSIEDYLETAPPLTGSLRIMMSEDLAAGIFDSYIKRFRQNHPHVRLNLIMQSRNLNLGHVGADVAIQTIPPREEAGEEGKKLCDVAWSCYISEGYRNRESWPTDPIELGVYEIIMPLDRPRVWRWLQKMYPDNPPHLRSTSLFTNCQMAIYGMGIAILPCYVGALQESLSRLFSPIEALREELWIVSHRDLRRTGRVEAFFEIFGELTPEDLARIQFENLPPRVRTRDQIDNWGSTDY